MKKLSQEAACRVTPYVTAKSLCERFTASLIKDFVTVLGGAEPMSKPCEALSPHGFLGKES